MRLAVGILLVTALYLQACLGQRLQARCSACRAVAKELADRLDKERPRNHLDMRHRLDKHGNRYGKVIDYKMSELRIIELLEGLCNGMSDWEFDPADKNGTKPARWVKSSELGANRAWDRRRIQENQKVLASYCGSLIEQYEDQVTHAIRNTEVDANDISDYLCFKLAKHCETTEEEELAAAEAAKEAAEEAAKAAAAAEEAAKAAAAAEEATKAAAAEPEAGAKDEQGKNEEIIEQQGGALLADQAVGSAPGGASGEL